MKKALNSSGLFEVSMVIEKNKEIYNKYVEKSPLQKIKIDTTGRTAKDIVKELIDLKLI